MTSIHYCPNEILSEIFSYLDKSSFIKISSVCRRYHRLNKVSYEKYFQELWEKRYNDACYRTKGIKYTTYCTMSQFTHIYPSTLEDLYETGEHPKKGDLIIIVKSQYHGVLICDGTELLDLNHIRLSAEFDIPYFTTNNQPKFGISWRDQQDFMPQILQNMKQNWEKRLLENGCENEKFTYLYSFFYDKLNQRHCVSCRFRSIVDVGIH